MPGLNFIFPLLKIHHFRDFKGKWSGRACFVLSLSLIRATRRKVLFLRIGQQKIERPFFFKRENRLNALQIIDVLAPPSFSPLVL